MAVVMEPQAAERTLYDIAVAQFQIAAERMGLSDNLRRLLSVCQREYTVNFPVQMDDGSIRMFRGHRVQHNIARGPAKGRLVGATMKLLGGRGDAAVVNRLLDEELQEHRARLGAV